MSRDKRFRSAHPLRESEKRQCPTRLMICIAEPLATAPCHTRPRLRLGADRKDVRHDHEPLWDATRVRLSHPSPITPAPPRVRGDHAGAGMRGIKGGGRGAGGEGKNTHCNASNAEFAHMFCPPLNPRTRGSRGGRHYAGMTHTDDVIDRARRESEGNAHSPCTTPAKGRGVSQREPAEHGMRERFRPPNPLTNSGRCALCESSLCRARKPRHRLWYNPGTSRQSIAREEDV
jgi:hypothetical protein